VTRLSRWAGFLEVESEPFEDDTPIFVEDNDPFTVRFRVKPVAWLTKEKAVPIYEDEVWTSLSFTKEHDPTTTTWTGKIRTSLARLEDADGSFLERPILRQAANGPDYPLTEMDRRKLASLRVRRFDKTVSASVPEEPEKTITYGT
jgi:hypothetical protein